MRKLIALLAVLALAVPVSANLINGNFDANSGTPNGWTLWGDGWGGNMDNNTAASGAAIFNPSPTEFGTYSYRCGEWNNSGGSAGIFQAVSGLTPGQPYALDFKFAWGNGSNNDWHEVGVNDGTTRSDTTLPGGLYKQTNTTEDFWHDVTLNFTPISSDITIWIKTGSSGGAWEPVYTWVDEMVLTPEPTALVIMMIGFLPILRRRH